MSVDATAYIECALCNVPISPADYVEAQCWVDPGYVALAAHRQCLVWIGETELDLPPLRTSSPGSGFGPPRRPEPGDTP